MAWYLTLGPKRCQQPQLRIELVKFCIFSTTTTTSPVWHLPKPEHQSVVLQSVERKTRLTHIVAGDECAEKLPLTPGQIQRRHISVVAPEWLESCLATGQPVDDDRYQIHLEFCCDSGLLPVLHDANTRDTSSNIGADCSLCLTYVAHAATRMI